MKKIYEKPVVELNQFKSEDIITTSASLEGKGFSLDFVALFGEDSSTNINY